MSDFYIGMTNRYVIKLTVPRLYHSYTIFYIFLKHRWSPRWPRVSNICLQPLMSRFNIMSNLHYRKQIDFMLENSIWYLLWKNAISVVVRSKRIKSLNIIKWIVSFSNSYVRMSLRYCAMKHLYGFYFLLLLLYY